MLCHHEQLKAKALSNLKKVMKAEKNNALEELEARLWNEAEQLAMLESKHSTKVADLTKVQDQLTEELNLSNGKLAFFVDVANCLKAEVPIAELERVQHFLAQKFVKKTFKISTTF
ncbi:hypothetical protein ACH5RR_003633 [Cinchona calisaya]|uniref:Uncharacterized protein n=1 Tax=Cinchona calisaya TaxID=153742 RepID=A0ABD3AVC7_9GENT